MDTRDLYGFLLSAVKRNAPLVLTFDDGDKYSLDKIDFCYSIGLDGIRDYEPLWVNVDDCLHDSLKRLQALREGQRKPPNVCWTTVAPIEPVGNVYFVENVTAIWLNRLRSHSSITLRGSGINTVGDAPVE